MKLSISIEEQCPLEFYQFDFDDQYEVLELRNWLTIVGENDLLANFCVSTTLTGRSRISVPKALVSVGLAEAITNRFGDGMIPEHKVPLTKPCHEISGSLP